MKKLFERIGLISLLVFSFFLTDKTSTVIKNLDDIMVMIKDNKKNYETTSIDAYINKDSIIPGISKRVVNVNKSYSKMKEYGKYNPNLYIYNYIKPSISITNNKDKYINSGNKIKRMVSLNFIVDEKNDLDKIITILNANQVSSTFFIDEDYLSDNLDLVNNLINNGYIIGIKDNKSNYKWMDTIITKVDKQKNIYCLYNNKKSVDKCKDINGYTIKGININNNYYTNIKKQLTPGAIFNLDITDELINNLDIIIKFIKKKGYSIENIDIHIKE